MTSAQTVTDAETSRGAKSVTIDLLRGTAMNTATIDTADGVEAIPWTSLSVIGFVRAPTAGHR
jgi:hypothetical protein